MLMPSVAHKPQSSAVGSGGQCTVSKSNEFMGGWGGVTVLLPSVAHKSRGNVVGSVHKDKI